MTPEQRAAYLNSWSLRMGLAGGPIGLAVVYTRPGKHGFWVYVLGWLVGGAVLGLAGKAIDQATGGAP